MTRQALSTIEVSWLLGIPAASVHRHLERRGVTPLGRVRVGRSWQTRWSLAQVSEVAPAPGPVGESD